MISINMNDAKFATLQSAIEDIECMGAPRHIDLVSAAVGMKLVDFARLGSTSMIDAIRTELRRLETGRVADLSATRGDSKD